MDARQNTPATTDNKDRRDPARTSNNVRNRTTVDTQLSDRGKNNWTHVVVRAAITDAATELAYRMRVPE